MKLNAEIIYQQLKKHYKVTMSGPHSEELRLGRPEFYMEDENVFLSDHLYLATVEHLPRRPQIRNSAVLVCIGENIRTGYYSERMCLITIHNRADFFRVFAALQAIYDQYDEWERTLYDHLINESDITQILRDSRPVLGCPLKVIDSSFRMIADDGSGFNTNWGTEKGQPLNADSLSTFMNASDLMTEKRGAILIRISEVRTLCVNLFDRQGVYEGCLCLEIENEEDASSKGKLAEHLASVIEQAIEQNPQITYNEKLSAKAVFKTLIEEQPLTSWQRGVLSASNRKYEYLCMRLAYTDAKNQVPSGYLCDLAEETFENAYAVVIDGEILCFVRTREGLREEIENFCAKMNLSAGVSDSFDDLFSIRIYYRQALAALENGQLTDPKKRVFLFADYALETMIINSLGDLPAEAYFPSGLRELIEHDESSGVSYIETLRVFLEENLSYTSAARKLYIHRSTLIDRIARIEKELDTDLHDTDRRLLLEMILKASEIERKIRGK
ncbi:MAG: helix-turn-helix domain-containing protein [Solobacterium sp.]|nr:helix-turn-helix domain-containing protein [Solobacterium sp.]